MTQALLLVGSPRGKKSASTLIGGYLTGLLEEMGVATDTLWLMQQLSADEKMTAVFEAIERVDIVVLAAPLYDDCQPFVVTRMMELASDKGIGAVHKRLLPIINCGFGETVHITSVSILIYKQFARKLGFEWAGSLAVGGGEMLGARRGNTFEDFGFLGRRLRRLLRNIATNLSTGQGSANEHFQLPRVFLSRFFMNMGNKMWAAAAEKNGIPVDARPYGQQPAGTS